MSPRWSIAAASSLAVSISMITPAHAAPPDQPSARTDEVASNEAPPADSEGATLGFEPPHPDLPAAQRAKLWFVRGVELYREERFTEAARAYEASNDAVASPSTVYNAALSHDRAGHKLLALETYESYLAALDDAALADPRVAEGADKARRRVRELTPEIAVIGLQVAAAVQLSEVRVDGEARDMGDFPLRVLPGPHKIEATDASGYRTVEVVDLLPGERARVRVDPAPEPEPATPVPPPQVEPDDGPDAAEPEGPPPLEPGYVRRIERVRLAGWSTLGLTGASAVTWAVLGALTLDAKADYEALFCDASECPDDQEQLDQNEQKERQRRFYSRREQTNVMIGVTGGLGIAAAALLISGFTGKAKRVPRRASNRRSATVSATAGGLSVRF